jgi:hypothetical protein
MKQLLILLIVSIVLTSAACKKNDPTPPNKRVVKITTDAAFYSLVIGKDNQFPSYDFKLSGNFTILVEKGSSIFIWNFSGEGTVYHIEIGDNYSESHVATANWNPLAIKVN